MRLVEQVREAAVESKHDIASLLRRAKILAAALKHDDLRQWVTHELDGYPPEAQLPDYRHVHSPPMGNFSGPFGSRIANYLLPVTMMPEHL